MSTTTGNGYRPQIPPPEQPGLMELSRQEREVIIKLRLLDYFRFQKSRKVLLDWNGVRLTVFDTEQVS